MFNIFKKLKNKIYSFNLKDKLIYLFKKPINEETLLEIEKTLYEADLGSNLVTSFIKKIKKQSKDNTPPSEILLSLKKFAHEVLNKENVINSKKVISPPTVILIVGINGSGKTSACSKLAKHYKNSGKSVLLSASDTFRAAAVEQLDILASRLKVDIVKGNHNSDPSAVAFDSLTSAKSKKTDVVIIDTAGRLHTKKNLMKELLKIKKTCNKVIEGSPNEIFFVLDGTLGQNSIDQAKTFNEFMEISGIILTKFDSSAKGGIALSVYDQLKIPIRYISNGETLDDFYIFNAENYIDALL